jgi:repressor LexA
MLTSRQNEILRFIKEFPHSYAPTVREIGKAVGLSSSSSVQAQLDKLKKSGYIEHVPNSPRTIKITANEVKL